MGNIRRKQRIRRLLLFTICDLRFAIVDFSVALVLFCGYLKKQSQFIRIAYSVMRIARMNLKKQTQFVKTQIDINSCLKGSYGIFPLCVAKKRTQFFSPQHCWGVKTI